MKKLVSLALAVIFALCFGSVSHASEDDNQNYISQLKKTRVEITSLRTDDCRFYKNEDGTITAEFELQKTPDLDIDNNLIPSADSDSHYQNKANRFKVKFPQQLDKEALNFSYQNTEMIFELQDNASVSASVYADQGSLPAPDSVSSPDKSLTPARSIRGAASKDKIEYQGVRQGVDLIYQVLDNGVKETIVIKDKTAAGSFSFKIKTNNLTWEEADGGRVFFSSMDTGEKLFYLNPVFALNSAGEKIKGVTRSITRHENGLYFDIAVDKGSLKDSDYPVYIDPTVTLSVDQYGMSTYIDATRWYTAPPIGRTTFICVGSGQNGLIKYNLSSIPKGTVINATLGLVGSEGAGYPMSAYRVTREWLESEATWFNAKSNVPWSQQGGDYDLASRVGGLVTSDPEGYSFSVSFNLTSLVQNWVNGGVQNNGIIIIMDPGNYDSTYNFGLTVGSLSVTYITDFDPPSVSLTAPAGGSTVSGNVSINADVQDFSGIQKVEFYVGAALIGTKTSSPYQVTWDTRNFPNGSYKIWAKAYDQAGNTSYSNYSQLSDTFDTNTKVDTAQTTAQWLDGYYRFNRYPTCNTLLSTTQTLSEPVKNALVESSGQPNFTFYVSADGGSNWQAVSPGAATALQYPGSQLKFKAYTPYQRDLFDYRLRCEKTNDYTVTVNNVDPVEPPAMLVAQSTADGKINLNWTASATANVTYRVYRSTVSGFVPSQDTLVAGGFSNTSYLDGSPLVTGTTYYYKVTAVNSTGAVESPPSNEAAITCGAGPQAPTGLSATPVSGGGIQLSWNPSPTSGVTYRLYRETASGFTPSSANLLTSGLLATSFTDNSGLVLGTAYYYRVSAVTAGGAESLFSNESGAVNGDIAVSTANRLGVKPFWTYTGLPLARGDGLVNLGSGNLAAGFTDSLLPGNRLVTEVRRTYNSLDKNAGALGYGWSANILQSLTPNPDGSVIFSQGDGYKANFTYNSTTGSYQAPAGIYLTLIKNPDNSFTITRKDNVRLFFDPAGKLTSIRDPNNNTITCGYTGGKLTSITDTAGRVTTITYDGAGRIASLKDQRANPTTYGYDGAGNLVTVTDPLGYTTRYAYDAACNLTEVTSPAGVKTRLSYDIYGHLTGATDAAGNASTFSWNFQSGQTVLTNQRGHNTTFTFNPAFGNLTSVTDALGGRVSYTYDANYNPTSVTDPGNHTVNHTFDGMGNMLTRQDSAGAWSVTYNSQNLPLTVTGPDSGVTRYSYDAAGNLTASTDPMNQTTTYENDFYGRRTKKIDPGAGVTTYGYDAYGNLTSLTDAESKTTTCTYNSMGDLTSSTDPAGAVTRYTYDDLGRLTRTDYPDGTFTTATLDGDDRITGETNQNGGATSYGYDAVGRVISVTNPRGYTTACQYDQAGNRTRVTDPEGVYTAFGYDALNRLTSATDALNNTTTFKYDACSNLTEIVHPLGHAEFFAYDSRHRKTSSGRRETFSGPNQNVTTYTYDSLDNLLTTTDPMANTTTYRYNLNNRLISVTDAAGGATSYGYDANGSRTSVTNAAANTTTYTYDKLGQVKTEQLPGGYATSWTYDSAGRLAGKTDPKGQTINYTYDTMNRLKKKVYPDGTQVTYTYDGLGNRLSMTDSLGATLYQYDAGQNLLEVTDCFGRKNTYTYDRAGKRKTLTTSFGTVTYEYNSAAQLAAITDFNGNRITLGYDADGKTAGITYPNGGTVAYSYNSLDQPVYIDNTTRINYYNRIGYQYNPNGYISSTTKDPSGRTFSFTYDNLNRLTQVSGSGPSYTLNRTYTYDKLGNRLTHNFHETAVQNNSGTYAYNSLNHLVSRTVTIDTSQINYAYGYDANGNPTSEDWSNDTKYSYYDYENRLIKTEHYEYPGSPGAITRYLYNGDGLLMGLIIESQNQTTYYQYDGNQVIADLDGAGSVLTHYTRLPSGKLLSMYKYESVPEERDTYYVFSDVLGSTVMLFGMTTGRVVVYDYDEFGTYSAVSGTDLTRFTFTGAPYYKSPGLFQMGARYYNPAVGRFITRDTYRGNIYQPWTQNLYTYCNNNPVNYVDPTGHWFETAVDVGSLAYDLYETWENPWDKENWVNLGIDVVSAILPVVNAPMVKGGIKLIDEAVGAAEGAGKATNWGMWDDVAKSTYKGREYANINGRYYTREAIDRMTPKGYGTAAGGYQARGIPTSVVEDVIASGTSREVIRNGITRTIFESNGVRVVTEEAGKIVITTMKY